MPPDLYRLLIALGIGAIIGAGYELLSLFATLIVLIVLIFLIYVQERIEALSHARTYRIILSLSTQDFRSI